MSRGIQLRWWVGLVAACVTAPCAAQATNRVRVDMELVAAPSLFATAGRQWHETLVQMGVESVRLRSALGGELPAVTPVSTAAGTTYRVLALLTQDDRLQVPGARFSRQDREKIAAWLHTLRTEGSERAGGAPRPPFGIPKEQLAPVQDDLSRAIDFSTKDMSAGDIMRRVASRLSFQLMADPGVLEEAARITIPHEMRGLANGTVLAIAARPVGCVLEPRLGSDGRAQYVVTAPKSGVEHWPLGWPPRGPLAQLAPKLFETVETELNNAPLQAVLDAVYKKLEMPMIFDQVAMARHGLDPAKATATVKLGRLGYATILDKVLFPAGMKYRLMADDAGRPFLWITSLKPVEGDAAAK